jgi:hypothetical protein
MLADITFLKFLTVDSDTAIEIYLYKIKNALMVLYIKSYIMKKKERHYFARKAAKNSNRNLSVVLDKEYADIIFNIQKELSELFKPKNVSKKYIIQYALERLNREDIQEFGEMISKKVQEQRQSYFNKG